MITLCTATFKGYDVFESVLLEAIATKLNLVNEVVISCLEGGENHTSIVGHNGRVIEVHRIDYPIVQVFNEIKKDTIMEVGHALGLHFAMQRASNDYILLCDPDVFYYMAADELYLETYTKFDLHLIGAAHWLPANSSVGYLPNPLNLMAHKSRLPHPEWKQGMLTIKDQCGTTYLKPYWFDIPCPSYPGDGLYLLPSSLSKELAVTFPDPNQNFDTGCNLWLWCHEQNGKWLSFPTWLDPHITTTRFHKNNFKCVHKFGNNNLLYHCQGSYRLAKRGDVPENQKELQGYVDLWEDVKKGQE